MTSECRLDQLLGRAPERMLIFRALVLGDMLCMIPAARALRRAYPAAQITLVSLPWAAEFAARFNAYFDDFLEFPGFPGLPERPFDARQFPQFLTEIQRREYDVAFQLHGSGSFVNPLTAMFNARIAAGFYVPSEYCPNSETFVPYPDDLPEVHRHLRVIEHLGIASCGDHLELPLMTSDHHELRRLPELRDVLQRRYVCLHPGARYLSRRWMLERYARVGDALASEGYSVVITGAGSEAELASAVSQNMTAPHVNLARRTSLGGLGALLSGAQLLISNDTGVSHVAAALRVPSIVIVTGSDPRRWAPLDRARHRLVMSPADCRPCEHRVCPIDFHCAERVTVEQVLAVAMESLAGSERQSRRSVEANTCGV
jgi:ADP-heptose:LPS heptosyltransferase